MKECTMGGHRGAASAPNRSCAKARGCFPRTEPARRRLQNTLAGVASIAAGLVIPVAAHAAAEELHLLSGEVVKGQFVEGDKQTIVFKSDAGLKAVPKKDVQSIVFAVPPSVMGSEFPPGFSAKAPLKLARVVAVRRITRNRVVEEREYEPEVVTISGDGSKVVFWSPKSGFWAVNADGSGRTRILARADDSDRFRAEWGGRIALSHDGSTLFWQGGQSAPIRRISIDGTDERLLVRSGAEYEPFEFREQCGRIFFSQRGGIFSIDTEGGGDYREIITPGALARLWEVHPDRCMLGRFSVSADGSRIAFVVGGYPKATTRQLMAIQADGSGLRRIVETAFDPQALTMSPDGTRVVYWKYGEQAYVVNWDGGDPVSLPIPSWDGNGGGFQHLNKFSPDGSWFLFNVNQIPGMAVMVRPDGTDRFEPLAAGRWDYYENTLFWGTYAPTFSANLDRCVTVSEYWGQRKPRQIIVADVNPKEAAGIPVLSDIEFPQVLSTNRQVPQHRGTIKVRVAKAESDVERVQFLLAPTCGHTRNNATRWHHELGWWSLQGDHLMNDAGTGGDEKAGDGVYTSDFLSPDAGDAALPEGRYHLRIVAHDDQNAVIVDVDGVDIR